MREEIKMNQTSQNGFYEMSEAETLKVDGGIVDIAIGGIVLAQKLLGWVLGNISK